MFRKYLFIIISLQTKYSSPNPIPLKVHKREIILNFYWPKSNPYMPFSLLFLRFSPECRSSNISAVTEHMRNNIFFERYPKKFLVKIFTLVLSDRFVDGFSKFFIGEICILIGDFWVIFENYIMRMLSIRGNDFIACWAYVEPISSHAEHTRNEFPRMLSLR